ncbi:uncharacterized protein FMAN_14229 [Fusarium mangiferae]|uniref:Uncharacterized protein n=1 Tax=Fusarium mangiferae TaxID=192010 RepID=A0A1L7UK06_FUSMA|nr:uncharacterized protein FMAN_14229 [Fusarium mangiferae]CVL08107.1 uncharacterized protein FMAN_14229 [Fusarium mangiferae]
MDLFQRLRHKRDDQRRYILSLQSNNEIISVLIYLHGTLGEFDSFVSRMPNLSLKASMELLEHVATSIYLLILGSCNPLVTKGDRILGHIKSQLSVLSAARPLIEALWDKEPMHVLEFLNFITSEILFLNEVLQQKRSLDSYTYFYITPFDCSLIRMREYRGFAERHAAARLRWHAFQMRDYKELVDCVPDFGILYSHLATRRQGDHLRMLSKLANSCGVREVLNMASFTALPIHLPYLHVEDVARLCQLLFSVSGSSVGISSEDVIISFFKGFGSQVPR